MRGLSGTSAPLSPCHKHGHDPNTCCPSHCLSAHQTSHQGSELAASTLHTHSSLQVGRLQFNFQVFVVPFTYNISSIFFFLCCRLTFFICSVGFTSPMLFDERKYPYHLMLQKFFCSGGHDALFEYVPPADFGRHIKDCTP